MGSDLPVMPGPEKPLLHIAIEFVEMLDNVLAEHQMLSVAHGELPAEAACIIDVPIDAVALPCPNHPQYGSALVKQRGTPGGVGTPKCQIKFCDGCPHINGRQCYCDPAFAGKAERVGDRERHDSD